MKIHATSDLHIEFINGNLPYKTPKGTDVVVLAGDIGVGRQGVQWALRTFDVPVVIIAGNHEAYGNKWKIPKLYDTLRAETEGTHVHFLQNDSVKIDDVLFVGTTLWTDYDLYGKAPLAQIQALSSMNDYRRINYGKSGERPGKLKPADLVSENLMAKFFLKEALDGKQDEKTVVVTHHAPSEESVPDIYAGEELNSCYASRYEYFAMDLNPNLWFHGHIHHSSDYNLGDVRVVANPRGYPACPDLPAGEINPGFDPNLLVEI